MAITCQPVEAMQTYAANATYREPIPSAKIDTGVIPLDSLPADWWNWLWYNITLNEGRTVSFLNAVFSEITSVYTAAGITPSSTNTDDLKKAIEKMCQVVATGQVAGSVLSSTLSGKLAVAADGTATINGLGTPSSLQTTADNVVAAINEVLAEVVNKAPTNHASTETTYGLGTSSISGTSITNTYGHVSLSCDVNPLLYCTSFSNYYLCGMAYSACDARAHLCKGAECISDIGAIMSGNYRACTGHVAVYPGCGLGLYADGIVCLNAPGYNCVGNVTTVCFNGAAYTPTNGVIDLGNITEFPGYATGYCPWNCPAQVGTSTLLARADHSHGCPWTNCCGIAIGCITTVNNGGGVAIGYYARTKGYGIAIGHAADAREGNDNRSISIGQSACSACCGIALGSFSISREGSGIALGYCGRSGECCGVRYSMIKTGPTNGRVFVNIAACQMECNICKGLRAVVNAVHCSLGYSQTSPYPQCCVPMSFYIGGEHWAANAWGYVVSSTNLVCISEYMWVDGVNVCCPIACQASCTVRTNTWNWIGGTRIWPDGASFTAYF